MAIKFKLLKDSKVEHSAKAGTTVYSCLKCDYGIARDDTRAFGYECVSVTFDEGGDYPFFSVPRHDLERVQ